ncbi:MAG: thiamine-phosphate kinase [Bacteroidetes bacterium QS_8_64_10]|nr:MAG: thiamine-phosphate kinase [Bacteroidetes bacterium QS_8_64_10]
MEQTVTPISEVGEFGLIERMKDALGESQDEDLLAGPGDDAAVYRAGKGRAHVATTDALIDGVHFSPDMMPLTYLGSKAVSINVSDVAAMNAVPRYALVTLGLPDNAYVETVEELYAGVRQAAEAYGLTVVGGDTTAAHRLTISVTIIGEAEERDVVYRGGAEPGDRLCVTGDLGGAYAGLKVLMEQREALEQKGSDYAPDLDPHRYVIQRQLAPTARLKTVQDWAERGVRPNALIDISDGLASEVHHICEQSDCGALVYEEMLPFNEETRQVAERNDDEPEHYAFYGGEDYELLFALPEAELDRLEAGGLTVIGECREAGDGVRRTTPSGEQRKLEAKGFEHFGA